ncbi:MAG: polymer-forming cytoskeletal protein [Oscillospiraceae bacterium]
MKASFRNAIKDVITQKDDDLRQLEPQEETQHEEISLGDQLLQPNAMAKLMADQASEKKAERIPALVRPATPPALVQVDDALPAKTVIAKGTQIIGDMIVSSDVEIMGEVCGNLTIGGSVIIWGRVEGNIDAANVDVRSGRIKGAVHAKNSVALDSGSVMLGDISGADLQLNGKLQGDVSVQGMATLGESSLQIGNVAAGRLSIHQGARLRGSVQMREDAAQPPIDSEFK